MSEKQRLALAYSANVDTGLGDPVCKVPMSAFDVINGDRKSKLPRAGRRKSLADSEQVTCWKCENNGIPTSRFRKATVARDVDLTANFMAARRCGCAIIVGR